MPPKKRPVPQNTLAAEQAINAILNETDTEVTSLQVDEDGSHHITIKRPDGKEYPLPRATPEQAAQIVGLIEKNKSRRR